MTFLSCSIYVLNVIIKMENLYKNLGVITVLFSLIFFSDSATAQDFKNLLMLGGDGKDRVEDIAMDLRGNTYITGSFENTLRTKSIQVKSNGGTDIFLAKISPDMKVEWIKTFGGTLNDAGNGIAVVNESIYLLATYAGVMNFNAKVIKSGAGNSILLAKFSSSGNVESSIRLSSTGTQNGVTLRADHENNLIGVLSFRNEITFEGTRYSVNDGTDAIIFKMDPNGAVLWTDVVKGLYKDQGGGVGIDGDNNIYFTGTFSGTSQIGQANFTADGNSDIFLVKYSPDGQILWVQRSRGASNDNVNGIAVDVAGNVYLSGAFQRDIIFGTHQTSSAADYDMFLVKYNDEGNAEWLRFASGGIAHDRGNSVAIDHSGNVYITGIYTNNITFIDKNLIGTDSKEMFVARYSADGAVEDVYRAGGVDADKGMFILAPTDNKLIAVGEFQQFATFDDVTLKSLGGSDIFIWKRN